MRKRDFFEEKKLKRMIYIFSITLIISIIAFISIFIMYNKRLKEQSRNSLLELGAINDIVSNEKIEETSYSSDKTIENSVNTQKAIDNNIKVNNTINKNSNNEANRNVIKKTPVSAVIENTSKDTSVTENIISNQDTENVVNIENTSKSEEEKIENKELKFIAPVSGEILKDFAMDTLIYSNTLEEWTTHPGIDIKANKTSIVVASEEGTVESIKNDPRYGLTIILSHSNGFKTIYSNLLTTEFVSEGKKVEQGETIATVGETASFEISDESHLHFEMYKDGELVNPTIYFK